MWREQKGSASLIGEKNFLGGENIALSEGSLHGVTMQRLKAARVVSGLVSFYMKLLKKMSDNNSCTWFHTIRRDIQKKITRSYDLKRFYVLFFCKIPALFHHFHQHQKLIILTIYNLPLFKSVTLLVAKPNLQSKNLHNPKQRTKDARSMCPASSCGWFCNLQHVTMSGQSQSFLCDVSESTTEVSEEKWAVRS